MLTIAVKSGDVVQFDKGLARLNFRILCAKVFQTIIFCAPEDIQNAKIITVPLLLDQSAPKLCAKIVEVNALRRISCPNPPSNSVWGFGSIFAIIMNTSCT